jgi:hypothetical protein
VPSLSTATIFVLLCFFVVLPPLISLAHGPPAHACLKDWQLQLSSSATHHDLHQAIACSEHTEIFQSSQSLRLHISCASTAVRIRRWSEVSFGLLR